MNELFMARYIAHARNGRISTSGVKSDVTVCSFLDPDFLQDAKISAIRVHLRHYRFTLYLHGVSGPVGLK